MPEPIIHRLPLTKLPPPFDAATRLRDLGATELRDLLRAGPVRFLVAAIFAPLRSIPKPNASPSGNPKYSLTSPPTRTKAPPSTSSPALTATSPPNGPMAARRSCCRPCTMEGSQVAALARRGRSGPAARMSLIFGGPRLPPLPPVIAFYG